MGMATGCGCKEVIDFLILLIPTPLVSVLQQHPYFLFIFKMFYIIELVDSISRDERDAP